MSRNGTGTYSVPNTFAPGGTITASDHNENWSDIGSEMTNSLALDGQSTMTGQFKASTGSAASPSITFGSDTNTGGYRHGADEFAIATGGTLAGYWDSAQKFWMSGAADIAGALSVTGASTFTGAVTLPSATVSLANMANLTHGKFIGRLTASDGVPEACVIPFGQCQLVKSGSNLVLNPFRGNLLTINSAVETIPDAGVTLTTSGLSNSTLYYVYAYMNSGTMTLEAVTTAYATQAGTGVMIKSGAATRTLVGMCYLTGSAFVDSATQRFVRSWFNDPGVSGTNALATNVNVTSASFAELNSAKRVEFLTWAGESIVATISGLASPRLSAAARMYLGIGLDSTTTASEVNMAHSNDAGIERAISVSYATVPGEGYHYGTILGRTDSGQDVNFYGASSGSPRCSISISATR